MEGALVPKPRHRTGSIRRGRRHARAVHQRIFARKLCIGLPLAAAFSWRRQKRSFEIASAVHELPMRELLESAAHDVGVDEFVLGRVFRHLRTSVLNGNLDGLENLLMAEYQTFEHDVLVIGAGGAGLRAAIEA